MAFSKADIDASLVRRLIADQFPQWAHLPIRPVERDGWDNTTFRLGEEMSVRLPSAEGYQEQVTREQRWLPYLAPRLPLPIPQPLALGRPATGYPWRWSVYRWLDGQTATPEGIDDIPRFAAALARFLVALQRIHATDGPLPGPVNGFRGGPLAIYDRETREATAALQGTLDAAATTAVWEAALAATWLGPPVWLHGDVAVGNLLIKDGQLSAVIDFGCLAVGDPACDLAIAWTLFKGESRRAFRAALPLDDAAWARGAGWALWKALITVVGHERTQPAVAAEARQVIGEVLADPLARL